MSHVAINDYGMGNLRSVVKAIEHVAPAAGRRDVRTAVVGRCRTGVFPGQGRCPTACANSTDAAAPGRQDVAAANPFSASASSADVVRT